MVRASQRERLLGALAESVAERGYAGAAVADVIERAGISRKTFYEHFSNKEECFLAAYDAGVAMVLDAIDHAVGAAPHPYAAAEAGMHAYVSTLREHPDLARAFFVEVFGAGPRALARRERVLERFADQLEGIYADAAAALPELPEQPPRYVFRAAVGAVDELVTRELMKRGPSRLGGLEPQLFDVEMRLLVGLEVAERIRRSVL